MEYYLWIKAFHIIAVIAWMAGMLYLPRLFVYHAKADPQGDTAKTLQVMEYKLLRYITTPAMIAALVFGGILIFLGKEMSGWLHAKLLLVFGLLVIHGMCAHYVRQFRTGKVARGALFFRIFNEIPAVLVIGIVLLAVIKPF